MFQQVTSQDQLLTVLKEKNKDYNVNVVTQDALKDIKLSDKLIVIVNFERKNEHGIGHWVVVLKKNSQEIVYFDPFGEYPPESILAFMRKFKTNHMVGELFYNKKQIQTFKDSYCGWACLTFVKNYTGLNMPMLKAINALNSKKIIAYGKQLYKTYF